MHKPSLPLAGYCVPEAKTKKNVTFFLEPLFNSEDLIIMDDWQLLNEYSDRNSEEAFRALVDRYSGMVYHVARRQVGNPDLAEEVAQAVFIALARKARNIPRQATLYGWLFCATRFAVLNLLRDEACRRRYEKEAMDSTIASNDADSIWQQIEPHLNDALDRLSRTDRELVMVRFFGNKSHKEVAETLGISEGTAKKRLSRALEKLRNVFARRGVAVSSVALVAAFATFGAQAAPAGLTSSITAAAFAHGAAGATATMTIAESILKLMAWGKAKTALAVAAGILFAAAGTATVALHAFGSTSNDLLARLAKQTGKTIVCDKHIVLPDNLDLSGLPLEQALDKVAVQASAYWTIDYAVYGSDQALRSLLDLLPEGATLESGGWTNLSSMALEPDPAVVPYDPHGRLRMFMRFPKDRPAHRVPMIVVAGPNADPQLAPPSPSPGPERIQLTGPPPKGPALNLLVQAMNDGAADGVLAPERLLAESRLLPMMNPETPVPATPEAAARLAKAAHAHWTTIYTLRKSPIAGTGIKLVHAGMESMYGPGNLSPGPDAMVSGLQSNRFNLSPEDRAAHQRAVEVWQKQNAQKP